MVEENTVTGTFPDLDLDLDAKAIVTEVTRQLQDYIRSTIQTSTDPETGSQKPDLSEKRKRITRKGGRGYATGRLAQGLGVKISSTATGATGRIEVPRDRADFVYTEARYRNVQYLSLEGKAWKIVEEAMQEAIENAAEKKTK